MTYGTNALTEPADPPADTPASIAANPPRTGRQSIPPAATSGAGSSHGAANATAAMTAPSARVTPGPSWTTTKSETAGTAGLRPDLPAAGRRIRHQRRVSLRGCQPQDLGARNLIAAPPRKRLPGTAGTSRRSRLRNTTAQANKIARPPDSGGLLERYRAGSAANSPIDLPTCRVTACPAARYTERDYAAPAFTESRKRRFSTQFSTQRGSVMAQR